MADEKVILEVESQVSGTEDIKSLQKDLKDVGKLLETLKSQAKALSGAFLKGEDADIKKVQSAINDTLKSLRKAGGIEGLTDIFRRSPNSAKGAQKLFDAADYASLTDAQKEALRLSEEQAKEEEKLAKVRERESRKQAIEEEKAKAKAAREAEKAEKAAAKAEEDRVTALEKLQEAAKEARAQFITNASKKVLGSSLTNPFAAMKNIIKGALGLMGKLRAMIGRVIAYRVLRSTLTLITQGVKEGIKNLYAYSQNLGTVFSSNMDRMKESALLVKNATAAMVAPILNVVTPALVNLADLFANIANQIGFFIAKLTGAASFSAAIRGNLSGAASAAKDLKKQVFGFDELNILNAPSGGGAASNAGAYFEEWDTGAGAYDQLTENIKAAIEAKNFSLIGDALGAKLNDVISGLPTASWGQAIGTKINNAVDLARGFLGKFDSKKLGNKIGELVSNAIGTTNWNNVGSLMADGLTSALDLVGGLIEKIEPAGLADAIQGFLTGWFGSIKGWIEGKDWYGLGNELIADLKAFLIDPDRGWDGVAEAIFGAFGAALGAAVSFISGAVLQVVKDIVGYFDQYIKIDENASLLEKGGAILSGILQGLLDAVKGIATWLWEHIISPFWQGFKSGFGIQEDGTSAPAIDFGDGIMGSFLNGIVKGFIAVKKWWTENVVPWWESVTSKYFQDPLSQYDLDYDVRNHSSNPKRSKGGGLTRFADGGFPDTGSLFIANEAGPELVGTIGNRTAVTNQEQFTRGLYEANMPVVSAIVGMANAVVTAINNKDTNAYLDGEILTNKLAQPIQNRLAYNGPNFVR